MGRVAARHHGTRHHQKREPSGGLAAMLAALMLAAVALLAAMRPAGRPDGPEAALSHALAATPSLTTLFGNRHPTVIGASHAALWAEDTAYRRAIVAFRGLDAANDGATGRALCQAALLLPEMAPEPDPLLAEAMIRHLAAGGRPLPPIEEEPPAAQDGWTLARCRLPLADLLAPDTPALDPDAIDEARYAVAKTLLDSGRRDAALERFRHLRGSPFYADAGLFILALLQEDRPALAGALRSRLADLDRAEDPQALRAYAAAMGRSGDGEEESRALRRAAALR